MHGGSETPHSQFLILCSCSHFGVVHRHTYTQTNTHILKDHCEVERIENEI